MKKIVHKLCITCALLVTFACKNNNIIETKTLNLSFIGDIMAHNVNFEHKPYSDIYKNVQHILKADDLTFANLEFPVDNKKNYSTYPCFNVHSEYVEAAVKSGCDIFSLSNNHSADRGLNSLKNTCDNLNNLQEEYNIQWTGIKKDKNYSFKPIKIEKNGLTIGFIAVTQFVNAGGCNNYIHLANYGIKNERENLLKLIKENASEYDLFIVSYHGGIEYKLEPYSKKRNFFIEMAEAGADIIYGQHPHVLQKPEILNINGKRHIIMHSCGNFISGQTWYLTEKDYEKHRSWTGDSAIFQINYSKTGDIENMKLSTIPISNYIDNKHTKVYTYDYLITSEKLSTGWKKFYTERKKLVEKLLTISEETVF